MGVSVQVIERCNTPILRPAARIVVSGSPTCRSDSVLFVNVRRLHPLSSFSHSSPFMNRRSLSLRSPLSILYLLAPGPDLAPPLLPQHSTLVPFACGYVVRRCRVCIKYMFVGALLLLYTRLGKRQERE